MADSQVEFGTRIVARNKDHNLGGAVMKIEAGKKTDLCFHLDVSKVVYVMNGNVKMVIVKDGRSKGLDLSPGSSFYINRGLVYQLEAVTDSIVVEFPSDANRLYGVEGEATPDVNIVSKGFVATSAPTAEPAPGSAIRMTDEDKEKLETPAPAPVVTAPVTSKTTPKKRTRKTSSTGKRTSKKKGGSRSRS